MVDIYRAGAVVLSVHPSDSDKVTKKVMGENTLTLSFTLAEAFEFKIGDYLFFDAEKYTLNVLPKVVKSSSDIYAYDLLLEGIEYELRKVRLLFATEAMGIGGGADFSLMGNAALFAQVIVANLNRIQTGWTVGSVIESETKNLTFSGDSCLTAINKVATEFSTEFWIGQDKTVNIGKKGNILPVTFEYGLGNGLYSIERAPVSSKDVITRLYPFGSEQNLPKGYVGKRLQIDGDYIEANVDKYGVIESSQNFDDIKPERTGTISALGADIFTFIDSSMDFDLNAKVDGNTLYLVPGTTAKIHFQSGDLAGYEFELSSYDHTTKAFKLIEFTNEIAYKLPNDTLKPAVGDTYIILDIYMPQTYVDAAKVRLRAKAQESLAQNSEPQVSYKTPVDHKFIAEKGLTLNAGDYVGIKDIPLGIDRNIRLVSVTRSVARPSEYDFELADTVEPSLTTQILTTLDNTDIVIRQNRLLDPARARRNYKATAELVTMIEVLKAEALLIGNDPAAQFELSGAVFNANANGDVNALSISSSVIAHDYYPVGNPGTWSMPEYVASALTPNTPYRLYIRASKSNATAMYVISDTTIGVEDVEGYYHFPVGILSSVIDGARVFQTTKGYTLITGDSIKTGTFVNKYGQTVLSLDDRTFYGSFTFSNGDNAQTKIAEAKSVADAAQSSANTANDYINSVLPTTIEGLQNQIDGVIDSWFYAYSPTLGNYPSSDWTTDAIKDRHIGDTFTNTQAFVSNDTTPDAGKSWRFVKNSGVYSWTPIADSDAVKALQNAAKAQDTADRKRRTFTSQPYAPYDKGDLWTQGNSIRVCDVPKIAGQAFAESDWSVTATDDTAAIAAQTTATAAALAASAVFPSDANLVAHWSFDEVSDMPDGAAAYRSKDKWTAGVDGWMANGGAISIDAGMLKIAGDAISGASMYRNWTVDFADKSLIVKIRSKNKIQNAAYYINTGYFDAIIISVIDDFNWIVRFDNLQNNNYNALIISVNRNLTNTEVVWFDTIYIGDCRRVAKLADNARKSNELELVGTIAVPGISGKALMFNGNEYAVVDSARFRTSSFTISCWVKCDGLKSGTAIGGFVSLTYHIRLLFNPNGTISFFGNGSCTSPNSYFGAWHHVAAVHSGTQLYLFIDGALVASGAGSLPWTYTNPLYLGIDCNNPVPYAYNGLLDEVRFYNKSLSASEVLGLYKHITKGKAFEILGQQALDLAKLKSKHYSEQPTTPYYYGDTWSDGVKLYRCAVSRETGGYTASDWEVATTYDNTQTAINGGVITSGTIQLGSGDGSSTYIKAGITGQGDTDGDVRIWSGASFANRAYAPFRVLQSGEVFARKRIELRDENDNGLAGICGSNSAADGNIRFWAGETYANRANAPFRVDKDGVVVMTKATLQSGTTGRRIEILSSEGILRMIGSNGQECIQLKETSYSGTVYPGVFVNLQSGDYKYVSSIEPVEIKASVYLSGAVQSQTKLSPSEIRYDNFISGKYFTVGSLSGMLNVRMVGLPYRSTGSSGMAPLLYEVSTGRIFMGS